MPNLRPVRLFRAISIRLLFGALSLLFISLVTFVAEAMQPGDIVTALAGEKASEEVKMRMRHEMGLDQPWPVRYVKYVSDAAHGDFGKSYQGTHQPVSEILAQTVPVTAGLAAMAILLASSVGIMLGTLSAVYANRAPDRAILSFSTLGVTLPNFVLAPILVLCFAVYKDWFAITWSVGGAFLDPYYLTLPVIVLAARPTALLTRLTRASMVETLQQEFIRTAVAKGVSQSGVIVKHALRNAILPVVTAIGTSFGVLLTGSFVVETAFVIPGLGQKTIFAITQGDTAVIQACILVTGAAFVGLNLIVDLILPLLDPRIRESQV